MAIIGFRAFFLIPQADSNSVPAARNDQCNFVLEALLLAQQRNGFVLDQLGKRRNAIGLQTERDTPSKHATSSVMVSKGRGGQSDLVQVIRRAGKKAQSVITVGQLSLIVKKIMRMIMHLSQTMSLAWCLSVQPAVLAR